MKQTTAVSPGDPPRKRLPANVLRHDSFNLFYIIALFLIDTNYMITGNGFWVLWYATMAYFIFDGIWVRSWDLAWYNTIPIINWGLFGG